jgi:hypothetical protein
LNLKDGSVYLGEPGTPATQLVLRPPTGTVSATDEATVGIDVGRAAAGTAYREAERRIVLAGDFFERLGQDERAELLLRATELMRPRHRAFPLSIDADDRAARRDQALENVRLAVAHQISLDHGDTRNARDLAEELRHVYGTTRKNEFARSGGMPIEMFGKTLFAKKGSASTPRYTPPTSVPLNGINSHLVGASIIDPDSLSRDVEALRTYTPDSLRRYRVRIPENGAETVLQDAPWPDHRQFFLLSHGNARVLLDSEENILFGPQVATFVRHRQDWRALRAENPNAGIILLGCDVGQVDGGPAQQVADHLGVTVYASRYGGWTLDNHLETASTTSDWGEFRSFLPGDASTTGLRFAHRDGLSSDQRRRITHIARVVAEDGIRLAAEMRLTPVVHVTGYNSGADQNQAQARVQSVVALFRQQLEQELDRRQHGRARPLGIESFGITTDVWEGNDVPPLARRNVRDRSPGELERHVFVTVHNPSPAQKLAADSDDNLGDLMFAAAENDLDESSASALAPGSAQSNAIARIPSTDEWSRSALLQKSDGAGAPGSQILLRPPTGFVARQSPSSSSRTNLPQLPSPAEWLSQSTVSRLGRPTSRSDELRKIDEAVRSARESPFDVERLNSLLSAITAWSGASSGTNKRAPAVSRLEGVVRDRYERLTTIRDVSDLVTLLQDSYRPSAVAEHHARDVFGRLSPPETPNFLVDERTGTPYDYSRLSTDEGVHFLLSMDIRRTGVRSVDMDPRRWRVAAGAYSVAHDRADRPWAPDPRVPVLPAGRVRMPKLVHAIWFGSIPAAEGPSATFWETFREGARAHGEAATFVLWTDVTRKEIQDLELGGDLGGRRGLHLTLLAEAAREANIVLVNVDEVYNASRAAPTTRLMRIERAKRSGAGWAAASDILRVQVVSDFGGMHVDGGDAITSLEDLSATGVVASERAFAVDYETKPDGRVAYQNNALVAPPHHPLLDLHLDKLQEHYRLDQIALYEEALRPPVLDGSSDTLNFKRHSVMYRTGPDLTGKVLESVGFRGTDVPRTTGISDARGADAMSWHPDRQLRDTRDHSLASGPATLAFTQDMVLTALRSLSLRDGDLDLYLLDAAISRHPRGDLVWESLFEFIRSDESLRREVRGITRTEDTSMAAGTTADDLAGVLPAETTVDLPERVTAMLDLRPGESSVRLGRRSEAVTLRPPLDRSIPGGARNGFQASVPALRPLPAPPERTATEVRSEFRRPLRLADRSESSPMLLDARRPWPLINRPVPGVTTRPSINQNVLLRADAAPARVEAERFVRARFPVLGDLNPVHGNENCNQAVVAVDRMLDGDTVVRVPPSGPAFSGLDLLQARRGGELLPVEGYDDVIDRIRERPGSRGVVYVGWDDGSHLFNVVDTEDGVVFLDGQSGHLALLPEDARWIALMRYQSESGTEPMSGNEPLAVRQGQSDRAGSVMQQPGQVRRPRQVSRTPATPGRTTEMSSPQAVSRSLPVQQAEAFYAHSVETLLARNPVRVSALLALLRRQTSTAEARPTTMSDVFQRSTGRSLQEAVNDAVRGGRLSDVDGDYVLALGDEVKAPGTSATYRELALPYRHARHRARAFAQFLQELPVVDTALEMLGEMDRDLNVLANLRRAWGELYPSSDMERTLSERWPEHRYVIRDLMGYADMGPVPMTQVAQWYERLPLTTFEHVEHGTVRVTPDHPEDGCGLRAYHWSAQLLRWGAMPRQVFATHGRDKPLALSTPYARDARHDAERTMYWRYHTAPVVQVRTDDGRVVPMVLDPAFGRGPLLIDDWAGAMVVPRESRYVEGGLSRVHADFMRERHVDRTAWADADGLPTQHMVLLTDGFAGRFPRPTKSRTSLNASWDDANDEVREDDDRLYRHWVRAIRRDLARSLWSLMQDAGARTADDDARESLLEDMYDTAERYETLPGFLDGNRELAWTAYELLGEERYSMFSSLFPAVPDGELLADDASDVGVSGDSQDQESAALVTQAMQTMVFADGEAASRDGVSTAQGATVNDDLADLRELVPASPVDMSLADPSDIGQGADSVFAGHHAVRFDARRLQLASGDWVSDASVRLRVQPGSGTTDAEAQLLADELVSAVEQQVNGPGFRLPGGDLLHLDLVVGPDVHAAHHAATLRAASGSASRRDRDHSSDTSADATVDQALQDVIQMVGGTGRSGNAAAGGGPLLSAADLVAIEQTFRSASEVRDSPHPLARREEQRAATVGDGHRSGAWVDRSGSGQASMHEAGTPHIVMDHDGTQWASGSRSARDAQGDLIPDDQRACVEVAVASVTFG